MAARQEPDTFVVEAGGERLPDVAFWETDKFKTVLVRVALRVPLDGRTAAHALLAEVLRRGTRRHPTRLLIERRLLELFGADLRTDLMRIGSAECLVLELVVPAERFLPEPGVTKEALSLVGEVLLEPALTEDRRFPEEVVEQERRKLLQELDATMNDKAEYAHLRLLELMYPDDPYAWPRVGRRQDLAVVDGEGLGAAYRRLLQEASVGVYAVGAEAGAIADAVRRELKGLRGGLLAPLTPPSPAVGRGVVAEERQPVAQGKLAIGYRTRGTAFSPEAYALRAMTGVLGAFSHSKLFRNVRERASLAYYVYARLDGLKGAVYVHAGIDPQNYARARAIVEAQVADLAAGEISDEEWQSTLLMLESQLRALTDHPRRMVDRHLERSLAGGYVPVADERERLLSLSRHEVAEAAAGLSPDVVFFLHG